jgi:hypothetical protein
MKKSIRRYYKSAVIPGLSVLLSHEESGFKKISEIVKQFAPFSIIELGTWWKGLTLVLHEAAPDAFLFSFDRVSVREQKKGSMSLENLDKVEAALNPQRVFCLIRDVLVPGGDLLVKTLCEGNNRKILYCDNGNKVQEVITYGHLLRSGDLMGVHDWGTEIDDRNTSVDWALKAHFHPHESNAYFVEKECLTRFFVKN